MRTPTEDGRTHQVDACFRWVTKACGQSPDCTAWGALCEFFGFFFSSSRCIPKHRSAPKSRRPHAVVERPNAEIDVQCIAACGHMHPSHCHQLSWVCLVGVLLPRAARGRWPPAGGARTRRRALLPRAGQLSLSYPSPPSLILIRDG